MRAIKFRAWDGIKMHLPEYSEKEDFFILPDGDIAYIKEVGVEGHELMYYRPDTWIIGQFTGKQCQDKSGKLCDIYEGDIIEFDRREWGGDDNIHIVEWDYENAEWSWGGGSVNDMEWRVLIGNIYENANLIKQ